jgi:hypothetical protein
VWVFHQSTGELFHDAAPIGVGYSGHGGGKNNPALQAVHDAGPIPRGVYAIGRPYDHPVLGPYTMTLTPAAETDCCGRGAFRVHGDSIAEPGAASHGCIVVSRAARLAIAASGDETLEVRP